MLPSVKTSKFKNCNGVHLLKNLFWEHCMPDEKHMALYTIKSHEYQGLPSLRQLYLSCEDLTEYTFAITYLDSWEHWEKLCASPWFQDHIELWRKELALKLKSEAVLRVLEEARRGGKNSFACNKWIVDKGYAGTEDKQAKRGRPSKAELTAEVQKQINLDKQVEEDFERIMN